MWSKPKSSNDIGKVWLTNAHLRNNYKGITSMNEFRIYSVELLDNGVYNYWTIDLGGDGQTVLFKLDQNSAVPTITMHRYAPAGGSNILKTIVYYIE